MDNRERNPGGGVAGRSMPKEVMIPLKSEGAANQAGWRQWGVHRKQKKQGVQRPYLGRREEHYRNAEFREAGVVGDQKGWRRGLT